jgi:hypothetical protein
MVGGTSVSKNLSSGKGLYKSDAKQKKKENRKIKKSIVLLYAFSISSRNIHNLMHTLLNGSSVRVRHILISFFTPFIITFFIQSYS